MASRCYYFSAYVADRGEDEPAILDELGNLQMQYRRNIGVVQRAEWQGVSDGGEQLAIGVHLTKVYDADGDSRLAKRKSFP